MKQLAAIILSLSLASLLIAQESEADLFGDSTALVSEVDAKATAPEASQSLLTNSTVKVGGNFTMTSETKGDPSSLKSFDLDTALGLDLFVDARPDEDFRVFVKGGLDYPVDRDVEFALKEAFADFNPLDGVYMRAGKQTANWGVGYFFSPANLLDLSHIDPEDPDAERSGPLAIKAQIPVGINNYYVYGIFEDAQDSALSGKRIAVAPKAEWVIGSSEIGLGGLWSKDRSWAAMSTFSGKAGPLDLIAEAVLHGNVEKTFIVFDESAAYGIGTETYGDDIFPQVLIGFNWSWDDDENRLGISLHGEYYYNGLGYEDTTYLRSVSEALKPLLASEKLSVDDLMERSRHYAAVRLGLNNILNSDFGTAFFWLSNLEDASSRSSASLTWNGLDHLSLSATYTLSNGKERSEFAPEGQQSSVSLKLSLTQGTF